MSTSTANVLFCDIVDSTRHRAEIGEVAADKFYRSIEQRFRGLVEACSGQVVKGGGDGVMAAFPAASDAVHAAVELQRSVDNGDDDIELRVGVAAGDVTWQDGDCYGMPVVVAARLQAACEAGMVLVSAVVRALAGSRAAVEYVPAGEFELKGIPEPVEAFELRWSHSGVTTGSWLFPPILPRSTDIPMAGRSNELDELLEMWSTSRRGEFGVAVLGGEAGAGKTRLATELAVRCHDSGGLVLAGVCDSELAVPYQPWLMVVDQLVAQLPDPVLDGLRPHLPNLLMLLPQVGDRVRGLAQPAPLDPENERLRVIDAIRAVLAAGCDEAPTAVIVDDLHWAGSRTLDVLRHLVATAPVPRCLIVATHRDTSAEMHGALTEVIAELRRQERTRHIKVDGMEASAIRELLHDQGATGDLPTRADSIARRTGGNAFLVTELVREGSPEDGIVPDGVSDVVRARLQRLSPGARSIANVIAVAERVDLRVLNDVALRTDVDLGSVLHELTSCALLQEVAGSVPSYYFSHALLRDAVRDQLSAYDLSALNHLVAQTIEDAHSADRRPVLTALARHYAAAAGIAGWEKAAYYGARAAAQAHRTAAYDEAVELIDVALPLTPGGTRQRCELLIETVGLLERCGRSSEAVPLAEEACEIAIEIDDVVLEARACVEMERSAHLANAALERSTPRLRRLLRRQDRLPDAWRVRAAASLGRACWLNGLPEAHDLIQSALDDARGLADDEVSGHVLEMACVIESNPYVALALATDLEAATDVTGDVFQSMWAMTRQTDALLTLGRLVEADAVHRRLSEAADRYRFTSYRYLSFLFSHTLALAFGDLNAAEAAAEAANTAEQDEFSGLDASGAYGLQMFMIRRAQGELEEMRPVLRLLARHGEAPGIWRPGLVIAYLELGMRAEAADGFDELTGDEWTAMTRDTLWPLALSFLADACVDLDRADVAALIRAELEPHAGIAIRAGYTTNGGPADRCRAMLAALCGDEQVAAREIADAAQLARRSGSPLWEAMTESSWAWICARRGDAAGSVEHHRLASEIAVRHGFGFVPARAPEAASGTETAHERWPDGLSEREIEVLRSLAAGLTNRQIADALFISPNTAANHVRSILQKTGSANRTEAAAYAFRHRLASGDGGPIGTSDGPQTS